MKAYISAKGELTVKSETDLEHYALTQWWKGWTAKESIFHVEITQGDFVSFKAIENDAID